jgi:hypothetical protein
LAEVYPPAPAISDDDLWARLVPALQAQSKTLLAWLTSAPQTNEVRRSSLLMAGSAVIAEDTGLPLRLYELGASAGLNLNLELYAHELGGRMFGDPQSPVRLAPDWTGAAPPAQQPVIRGRRGVDLNPINVSEPSGRNQIIAYLWADQLDRIDRTTKAIQLALENPPEVDAGDAADWLETHLAAGADARETRVVMHTIAYQYFPDSTQQRVQAPLAWLRFEMGEGGADLRLTLWPGGQERRLARAQAHGAKVVWLGSSSMV